MNPYQGWVSELERWLLGGARLPLGGHQPAPRPAPRADAPLAMIFAPHPDDEVITGGLALRLSREAGWRVIAVAVTQGSNTAAQAERWREFVACCAHIGFEPLELAAGGLREVNLAARSADPARWAAGVDTVGAVLARHAPKAVFFPHAGDWHVTHVGTHQLVLDALASLGEAFQAYTVETEYWGASRMPNVVLELGAHDVAELVAALSFHAGQVRRNPYHLTLPAHLIDNVRRGAELVLGKGQPSPAFTFAALYSVRKWQAGGFVSALTEGRAIGTRDSVADLLP